MQLMNDHAPWQPVPDTIAAAVARCAARLDEAGVAFGHGTDNPWDEAVQLVLGVLGLDDGPDVAGRVLAARDWAAIRGVLDRRIGERSPLPYLLGEAHFAGLRFRCDPRALVPRSPLGELIEHACQPWYGGPPPRRLLDLCCGGGCLGIAAAVHMPGLAVVLADLDDAALTLAAENVARHDVGGRVSLRRSDGFDKLADERFDIILCNPPYVDVEDLAAMPAEFHHEPAAGLGAGDDGLDLVRRLLPAAAAHLEEHGLLLLEVGNSWPALEAAYPRFPFTWVELERGGHGVAALTARELRDHSAALAYNPRAATGQD
ncbi:50S ribosomal protein L3 N(5)-glutamine methyltransferase [Pseudohaliea rubra]|uniref:Protein-N(5)-glutamine methyltransferase PrmB, methylates LSU ribosomal protein L3p n=1 Tax=Pseudohaliea rubra DSM 19751 TaxID=1265313 RepID=A0A095WXT3_9GAMM|nr:50S ribosomal protein L3 N(5)-glutamine methyltransferase [Pseudohaliea rubra]KGE03444.1 Protein-N(5)-glutamine methyltransferase PrmB, methylates LSU ribosomal protein L3p [Pseudohaliea rubra DSM 19751]